MALVECPDCGKQVSEKAEQCIHCGAPIANKSAPTTKSISGAKLVLLIAGGVILGIVGWQFLMVSPQVIDAGVEAYKKEIQRSQSFDALAEFIINNQEQIDRFKILKADLGMPSKKELVVSCAKKLQTISAESKSAVSKIDYLFYAERVYRYDNSKPFSIEDLSTMVSLGDQISEIGQIPSCRDLSKEFGEERVSFNELARVRTSLQRAAEEAGVAGVAVGGQDRLATLLDVSSLLPRSL